MQILYKKLLCRLQKSITKQTKLLQHRESRPNKKYQLKNHENILAQKRISSNNKYKSDISFCLICKTRSKIRQVLKDKVKSSSTIDILGIDLDTYRKWLEFQLTREMNWQNVEIDHVKPICIFDVSKDEELKKAFSWKNT